MSDYTLNILKMKSKKYEDYVNCINPDYNRDEEAANEVITRFNEYEKENQELKNQLETLEKTNKQLISKLDRYDAIVDERDELKKQLEVGEEQYNDLVEEKEKLQEQLSGNTLQLEEYKHKGLYNTCLPYSTGYKKAIKEKENQQKEFIDFLESELDRLARECSQIYEDSLGKTRLVNKDIFNEVDKILSKYKEIIGVSNEKV